MNTHTQTITLNTGSGPLQVVATVYAGLALHPYVLHNDTLSTEYYIVTHVASGWLLFDTPIKGVRKARRYFTLLSHLTDWNQSFDELIRDKELPLRIKVLQKEMGI